MTIPLLPRPDGDAAHERSADQGAAGNAADAASSKTDRPQESRGRQAHRSGPQVDHGSEQHRRDARRPNPPRIASEEECLAALSGLPALVLLGRVSVGQARTMQASYVALLQHYRQRNGTERHPGLADEALVEMVARHPETANDLAAFLSDEQLAAILARAMGNSDEVP